MVVNLEEEKMLFCSTEYSIGVVTQHHCNPWCRPWDDGLSMPAEALIYECGVYAYGLISRFTGQLKVLSTHFAELDWVRRVVICLSSDLSFQSRPPFE